MLNRAQAAILLYCSITWSENGFVTWQGVKKFYQGVNTIQGNFVEQICSKETGACVQFKGRFYFKKPGFFRIEVQDPKPQLIIADGDSITIFFPDEKRALKEKITEQLKPLKILEADTNLWTLVEVQKQKESTVLVISPKDPIFKELRLGLNPKSFAIGNFTLIDDAGQETICEFSKVKHNKKIPQKLFKFIPPKGTRFE